MQEALLNACKYSDSDQVDIDISVKDGNLVVSVRDYGRGFDTVHPTVKGSGGGMPGMRERARIINGTLSIKSDKEGTEVTLRAPINEEVEHD